MNDPSTAPRAGSQSHLWARLQQPRVVLLLLAAWAVLGALSEFFSSSGFFVDLHGGELDGALGGRALSWESVPLAAAYLYAARDPDRYHIVFWLALVEQAAALAANFYHWGAGDFSFESIAIPVAGAAALGVLVLMHLFRPGTTRLLDAPRNE